ncbi:DUF6527 family protein [Rufibacter roseus]|uniref:DUF6527 family protein n=1 Tax=Rufibacter roseus TaxID=1567108 RepID=A0ABW2DJQ7_9BACT|nr:DUF6527 family protein [Rufibacter roseus]
MKTIKQVAIEPVFVEYVPESMEEGKLYISKEFGTALHKCLCGCGNETVTPLGKGGWQLTEKGSNVSLHPSIGNYGFPCQSHYIITNNKANFV